MSEAVTRGPSAASSPSAGVGVPRVALSGRQLPNPRIVSTYLHREDDTHADDGRAAGHADNAAAAAVVKAEAKAAEGHHQHPHVTFMFVTWGQLLDHDITLTAETKGGSPCRAAA